MDEVTARRAAPRRVIAALLVGLLGMPAALAQDPAPRQAEIEAMFAADQYEEAYARLAAWRGQYGGQLWFDALLGRAAAKSERYDEAIAVLGRVVEQHPAQDSSRFFLALALARSGQREAAAGQYRYLAEKAAAPASQAQARDALNVLAGGEHEPPTVKPHPGVFAAIKEGVLREKDWSADAVLSVGYDTNANSATDDERLQPSRFDEQDVDSETMFVSLGGQMSHRTINSDPWVWRNSLSAGYRTNPSAQFLNTDLLGVQSELRWKGDDMGAASGLFYARTWLDGSFHDSVVGWLNRFERTTDRATYGAALQYAVVRYTEQFDLRDVDSWVLEASAGTRPDEMRRWSASLTPLVGIEDSREPDSPFGRFLYGLRGRLGWEWQQDLDLSLHGGAQRSRYDDVPGSETREDTRYSGGVGLTWRPAGSEDWALSTGLSYSRNESNAPAFDYDRLLASVEVVRSWGGEE